jgi:hypothetical protein
MKNDAQVTYVNELEASGIVNGVINMAFSTYAFVPELVPLEDQIEGEPKVIVGVSPEITVNIRFDLRLAQIMRDRLDALIEANTKPKVTN